MYEYIHGDLAELNPSYVVIDAAGVGFFVNISLHTYSALSALSNNSHCKLFVHHIIREDAHLLFGFADRQERELFRLLISVSGIGANTARLILSSLSPEETKKAIASQNITLLKSIKGIGLKTAERIVVDLKDKMNIGVLSGEQVTGMTHGQTKAEALAGLVTLGFAKTVAEKTIDQIIKDTPNITVEQLVKESLKRL